MKKILLVGSVSCGKTTLCQRLNGLVQELRLQGIAILAVTHCQIFDGINKVMQISETPGGDQKAVLSERREPSHPECLESFR